MLPQKNVSVKTESFLFLFVGRINLGGSGSPRKHAINTLTDLPGSDPRLALSWQMNVLCGDAQDKHRLCEAALFCGACTFTGLATRGRGRPSALLFGLFHSVEVAF